LPPSRTQAMRSTVSDLHRANFFSRHRMRFLASLRMITRVKMIIVYLICIIIVPSIFSTIQCP
jgi:t-SNARE complex subunit (syntaxin)